MLVDGESKAGELAHSQRTGQGLESPASRQYVGKIEQTRTRYHVALSDAHNPARRPWPFSFSSMTDPSPSGQMDPIGSALSNRGLTLLVHKRHEPAKDHALAINEIHGLAPLLHACILTHLLVGGVAYVF
jgi:hypothetical protein